MLKISNALRILRSSSGMSQEDLARKVNIKGTTIRKYEYDLVVPKTNKLLDICDALNIEPNDLRDDAFCIRTNYDRTRSLDCLLQLFLLGALDVSGTRNHLTSEFDANTATIRFRNWFAETFGENSANLLQPNQNIMQLFLRCEAKIYRLNEARKMYEANPSEENYKLVQAEHFEAIEEIRLAHELTRMDDLHGCDEAPPSIEPTPVVYTD